MERCVPHSLTNSTNSRESKKCIVCSKMITKDEYLNHMNKCGTDSSVNFTNSRKSKKCIVCSKMIPKDEYLNHMNKCGTDSSVNSTNSRPTTIPKNENINHANIDADRSSMKQIKNKNTKECIICFKDIIETDYVAHVNACLTNSSSNSKSKQTSKLIRNSCFTW